MGVGLGQLVRAVGGQSGSPARPKRSRWGAAGRSWTGSPGSGFCTGPARGHDEASAPTCELSVAVADS